MKILLSDLIDLIHITIIKNNGENEIALKEIENLYKLIKNKKLKNYNIEKTEFFNTIKNNNN